MIKWKNIQLDLDIICYLHSVTGFFVHNRNIGPSEYAHELQHNLCLVDIRRNGPQEVRVPVSTAQYRAGGEKAHLERQGCA